RTRPPPPKACDLQPSPNAPPKGALTANLYAASSTPAGVSSAFKASSSSATRTRSDATSSVNWMLRFRYSPYSAASTFGSTFCSAILPLPNLLFQLIDTIPQTTNNRDQYGADTVVHDRLWLAVSRVRHQGAQARLVQILGDSANLPADRPRIHPVRVDADAALARNNYVREVLNLSPVIPSLRLNIQQAIKEALVRNRQRLLRNLVPARRRSLADTTVRQDRQSSATRHDGRVSPVDAGRVPRELSRCRLEHGRTRSYANVATRPGPQERL